MCDSKVFIHKLFIVDTFTEPVSDPFITLRLRDFAKFESSCTTTFCCVYVVKHAVNKFDDQKKYEEYNLIANKSEFLCTSSDKFRCRHVR